MVTKKSDYKEKLRQSLSKRQFKQAADLLEEHLAKNPDDIEAKLELGLIEFLQGRRVRFDPDEIARSVGSHQKRPNALWQRYSALAQSTARAVAILTLAGIPVPAALSGCSNQSPAPPQTIQTPATTDTAPATTDGSPEPPTPPSQPATNDSGQSGDADPAETDAGTTTSQQVPDASQPAIRPRPRPYPRTRYIAIRPQPIPPIPQNPGTNNDNSQ